MVLHKPLMKPLIAALAFCGLLATPMLAHADPWKDYRGDCDDTAFKTPDETPVKKLKKCVKLWQAYKDIRKVKGAYKDRVVEAMRLLYVNGSDKDAKLAKGALKRLGVAGLPSRGKAAAKKPVSKKPARKKFSAEPPSKKEKKSADRYFKKGIKAYKKKKMATALKHYLKMTEIAPGYGKGHYNVACIYSIEGDMDNMTTYLQNLADLGTEDTLKLLRLARGDGDFAAIRDENVDFKRLTGYAKIKVLNSLGDMGEDNVDNLVAGLKKLGHEVEDVAPSKKKRSHPIVWYAPHAQGIAYITKKLLNHPKTKTVEFSPKQLKGYDMVVTWGDKIKGDEPDMYVDDPDEIDQKLDDLRRTEDELLSKPEEAIDDVQEQLDKPKDAAEKVEDTLEKPGKAVDRAEKTVDKVKGLFD